MEVVMRSTVSIALAFATVTLVSGCGEQAVSYKNEVEPLLKERCLECHDGTGEGSEKSGFNVTDYASLMKGTKFGPVVVPGDSASSTLFRIVGHQTDESIQMPPHHDDTVAQKIGEPLTDAQIAMIKTWIDQGARNN